MAVKELTPQKGDFNKITGFKFEAATTAADGMKFNVKARDEEVVVFVRNTNASTNYNLTVKAPKNNGGYAAAMTDMTVEIPKSGFAVIRLESARFAENDGTVTLIPANVAVEAAVIC